MWVALPEATRHSESAFEHHDDLPLVDLANGRAMVLIGTLGGATSAARADTRLVGAQLDLLPGVEELAIDTRSEHAVVPIDAPVMVEEDIVEPGWLGIVPGGRESLRVTTRARNRVMLVGGEPLGEKIEMWWNFVARSKAELTEAWRSWQDHDTDRFAPVPTRLPRIDAPPPPWAHD
jgi:redox-sensitive bicupin YhaK (pirin superfamily)